MQIYLSYFGSEGLLMLSLASGLMQATGSHSFSYVALMLCGISSWLKVLVGERYVGSKKDATDIFQGPELSET